MTLNRQFCNSKNSSSFPDLLLKYNKGFEFVKSLMKLFLRKVDPGPAKPFTQRRKGPFEGLLSCGRRIRTSDAKVMSLVSYHCSIPRYILKNDPGKKSHNYYVFSNTRCGM